MRDSASLFFYTLGGPFTLSPNLLSQSELQPMASDSHVSRVLGAGLPTMTNWLDVNWLLDLFDLRRNGVEFREFQKWARTVASGIPFPLDKEMHQLHLQVESRVKAPVESSAWGVSRMLGTTLPARENWLDNHWLEALFGLGSQGVKFSAFRSWSRNVALGKSFTPDMDSRKHGLVEVLPSLLMDSLSLQFKSPELAKYVEGLDGSRFYEEYLLHIKAHLEKHKLVYWKRLDVTITIQARLGLADVNAVPQRVREFYNSHPRVHGSICHVVEEGSNWKPWAMQCDYSIGVHGSKKAARMIAIIKENIDPSFDPEGDSPPPPVTASASRKRKR